MNDTNLRALLYQINEISKTRLDTAPSEALYLINGKYVYLPNTIEKYDIIQIAKLANFTGVVIETDFYVQFFKRRKNSKHGYILDTLIFDNGKLLSDDKTDEQKLPKGVEPKRAVSALIRNRKGEILIQEHKKLECFTLPGGKVDKDESPISAIKRELKEELGITVKKVSFNYTKANFIEYPAHSNNYNIHEDCNWIIRPSYFEGEITNMEPDKHPQLLWLTKREIIERKLPVSVVLEEALNRLK